MKQAEQRRVLKVTYRNNECCEQGRLLAEVQSINGTYWLVRICNVHLARFARDTGRTIASEVVVNGLDAVTFSVHKYDQLDAVENRARLDTPAEVR